MNKIYKSQISLTEEQNTNYYNMLVGNNIVQDLLNKGMITAESTPDEVVAAHIKLVNSGTAQTWIQNVENYVRAQIKIDVPVIDVDVTVTTE